MCNCWVCVCWLELPAQKGKTELLLEVPRSDSEHVVEFCCFSVFVFFVVFVFVFFNISLHCLSDAGESDAADHGINCNLPQQPSLCRLSRANAFSTALPFFPLPAPGFLTRLA